MRTTLLLLVFTLLALPTVAAQKKFIGYYPAWAVYRTPAISPSSLDASKITHINYAFAKPNKDGTVTLFDEWADTQKDGGNFKQLNDLKKKYSSLKVLISIGGWTLSDNFPTIAANANLRKIFAQQCVNFCKKYNFDGIDIDWEFPGFKEHQGTPADKQNFTLLLKELYEQAKKQSPQLLVTIAAPAAIDRINDIELDKIKQYVDWINIMAYDFNGPWAPGNSVTNHNAPLYPPEQNPSMCVDKAVSYYLEQGVPASQLVVGLPLYGRSFAGVNQTPTGLFSSYSGPGKGTVEPGIRSFADLKQNVIPSGTYKQYRDEKAMVPYLYDKKQQEFISYDDEESLKKKVQYLKEKGCAGGMVWDLSQDTPNWDGVTAIKNELDR